MKKNLENIIKELSLLNRYGKLLSKLEEVSPPPDSFVFEAMFAYVSEKSRLSFQYEIKVNPNNNTTVDFVYEEIDKYKLCFELFSPDLSESLKIETEPKGTDIEGIRSYEVLLESNQSNEHLRPEAQTIRLQEKVLEKVEKFPEPIDNVFSTIVVDCTNFRFGHFDPDDCRMVMYGRTRVPEFQEYWGHTPTLGLLNPSLKKKFADNFRTKITSVIFIPKLSYSLLQDGFLILNHHRPNNHLQEFWTTLSKYDVFRGLKCLPFPS